MSIWDGIVRLLGVHGVFGEYGCCFFIERWLFKMFGYSLGLLWVEYFIGSVNLRFEFMGLVCVCKVGMVEIIGFGYGFCFGGQWRKLWTL